MATKRGRFSTGLALVALLAVPSAVSAEPPPAVLRIIDRDTGDEQIRDGEPLVCEFAIEMDFETDGVLEDVGWKIKVFTDDPFAGETVAKADDGPTDEDGRLRQPREGWLSLPDGRYNLIVDDEYPPDASALFRSFTVECAEATPTPAPTEAPTPTPTPTPTPSPAPTETTAPTPTPPPQGGVETPTPTPQPTLPPTDVADSGGPDGGGSLPGVLLVLGVLVLGMLALTPAQRPRRPR